MQVCDRKGQNRPEGDTASLLPDSLAGTWSYWERREGHRRAVPHAPGHAGPRLRPGLPCPGALPRSALREFPPGPWATVVIAFVWGAPWSIASQCPRVLRPSGGPDGWPLCRLSVSLSHAECPAGGGSFENLVEWREGMNAALRGTGGIGAPGVRPGQRWTVRRPEVEDALSPGAEAWGWLQWPRYLPSAQGCAFRRPRWPLCYAELGVCLSGPHTGFVGPQPPGGLGLNSCPSPFPRTSPGERAGRPPQPAGVWACPAGFLACWVQEHRG